MSIGEALLGALGAGGNILGSLMSTAQQKSLAKYQAKLNYKYAEKSARNTPTWNRAGLENAGYNPMLAVQNATSGANSSWASPQSSNAPDIAGGISSGIANAQSFQRLKNETQVAESQNDMNYANADKAKAEKSAILQKLPFISSREKAEIANIDKDSLMKESQIHNIDETTRFIEKEYELRKRLGELGIYVQKYGYDTAYNAQTYSANKSYEASRYSSDTQRGIKDFRGFGFGYRGYTDLPIGRRKVTKNYSGFKM